MVTLRQREESETSTYPWRYIRRIGPDGEIDWVWECHVPRIGTVPLGCVVYLYQSVADAQVGRPVGGTGFLIGMKSEVHKEAMHVYAVSNRHVVIDSPAAPVIRVNTVDGRTKCFFRKPQHWIPHPKFDLALCPIELSADIDRELVISQFLTKPVFDAGFIGVGDDIFMVGRFIRRDGVQTNVPAARFGNIAMLPMAENEEFLVEMRSLPGFSGSPVFEYTGAGYIEDTYGTKRIGVPVDEFLIGIDRGHTNIPLKIRGKDKQLRETLPDGSVVLGSSGMASVIPAWHILEVSGGNVLMKQRKAFDKKLTEKKLASDLHEDADKNPSLTEHEFENVLRRVSRRLPVPPARRARGKKGT